MHFNFCTFTLLLSLSQFERKRAAAVVWWYCLGLDWETWNLLELVKSDQRNSPWLTTTLSQSTDRKQSLFLNVDLSPSGHQKILIFMFIYFCIQYQIHYFEFRIYLKKYSYQCTKKVWIQNELHCFSVFIENIGDG